MKTCATCKESLPEGSFWKKANVFGGLQSSCKDCMNAYRRGKPKSDAEREWHRKYDQTAKGKATQSRKAKEWAKRNPEKRKAHQAVMVAVRSGRLVSPEACSECGFKGKVEAHHDDYRKLLEVRWVCRPCHREHHKEMA